MLLTISRPPHFSKTIQRITASHGLPHISNIILPEVPVEP
jgi:hypothetical protein